jgi:hypothetical protein
MAGRFDWAKFVDGAFGKRDTLTETEFMAYAEKRNVGVERGTLDTTTNIVTRPKVTVNGTSAVIANLISFNLLRWADFEHKVLERQTPERASEFTLTQAKLDALAAERKRVIDKQNEPEVQKAISALASEVAQIRAERAARRA